MPRHWRPKDPRYLLVLWADDWYHRITHSLFGYDTWLCNLERRMWHTAFAAMKERERGQR